MLIQLLLGMSTLALIIQPVGAYAGPVTIMADGSVSPSDAPILRNGNVYTLTGNITLSSGWTPALNIQKNSIVINGAGYFILKLGNPGSTGMGLSGRSNVTIKNTNVQGFGTGINLDGASYNTISQNNFTSNTQGIRFVASADSNVIQENRMKQNTIDIYISSSNNNQIYHDYLTTTAKITVSGGNNIWDNGYPSGGNYWSGYTGNADLHSGLYQNETGRDGIADSPYIISAGNQDRYPLMYPWNPKPVNNINTGLGYSTIQAAIDAPETLNGHTIYAKAGIYYEHVVMGKSVSLFGAGKFNTIIDGSGTGKVIYITAAKVTITSFTIKRSGPSFAAGIYISSSNNSICSNIIRDNADGIWLKPSSHNTISENCIVANTYHGIIVEGSSTNTLTRNRLEANSYQGILVLSSSNNNTISENNILTSDSDGIWLRLSSNYNSIRANNITGKTVYGILLTGSSQNTISGNVVANSQAVSVGLNESSSNNIIVGNVVRNNLKGIELASSSSNKIYHNDFTDNNKQVNSSNSLNVWDDGYPSGGNYWDDYAGSDLYSGIYQNKTGGDGIGDTPYTIDINNIDTYPLIHSIRSVINLDTDLTYSTIQSAINAPETLNGHRIFINVGTYNERIVIDKSLSLSGANRLDTIIDGGYAGKTVEVTSSNVYISNLTLRNSQDGYSGVYFAGSSAGNSLSYVTLTNNYYGIWLSYSSNNIITACEITDSRSNGIFLDTSANNVVSENHITDNYLYGIEFWNSNNNIVSRNEMKNNSYGIWLFGSSQNVFNENNITNSKAHGILLLSSTNNTISGNNITDNYLSGLYVRSSNYNEVTRNNITNNNQEDGIYFLTSSNNLIIGNNITDNNRSGVLLLSSANNTIRGNTIAGNHLYGLYFDQSNSTIISGNTIARNKYPIWLSTSSSNRFYHNNFVNNSRQVFISPPDRTNFWDNGYPNGGNYWSTYTGTDLFSGPYQNETSPDGIGDTAYILNSYNIDRYPIMGPYEWSPVPSDVNRDGIVDIIDVGYVSAHWYPGPPEGPLGYDMYADINDDGEINIIDVALISAHWGESW